MKKIYSVLALAAAVSMSASAGVKTAGEGDVFAAEKNLVPNGLEQVVKESSNGPEKEINYTTAEEIAGYYIVHCNSGFDQDDHEATVLIEKGAADDEVIVYGFWNGFGKTATVGGIGVKGVVKNAGGKCTIVFTQQQIAQFTDGPALMFYPYNPSTGGGVVDNMTLTVCPQGVTYQSGESAYEEGCLAVLGSNNFFLSNPDIIAEGKGYSLWYNIILCPLELYGAENQQIYTVDESEWTSLGNGKFDEGYLFPLTHEGNRQNPYDVEVLQKNDGSNVFLVKNPFGVGTPFETANADATGTGYIYIDATNADLVCVRPLVYSGMNDLDQWEGRLFCANDEGVQLFLDESDIEDILDYFDYYELETSKMIVDGDNATISIRNGAIGHVTDLYTYAPWTSTSGSPIECESTLTFKLNGAGVDGVIADNVAKRYFNLQGVEIAQPEAGQVVIVREGSKAVKSIVR